MGVRETLNQSKYLGLGLATGLIVAGVSIAIWANASGMPGPASKAFYSDDDGKTYFADDIDKPFPFDHGGRPAVRAYVYQCGAGKPFVAYLERLTDAGLAKLTALRAKPDGQAEAAGEIAEIFASSTEVKSPGDAKWLQKSVPAAGTFMRPGCPPGGGDLNGVYP